MIVLGSSTEVLRARLAAAPSANQPTFLFAYGDDNGSPVLGNSRGTLSGTSNVNLVGSPTPNVQRAIHSGSIYNADTAPVTLIVEHYDGTTAYAVTQVTLSAGATLELANGGWQIADYPADTSDSTYRKVVSFSFGDASPAPVFTASAGCTDVLARIVIDTPFNGAGAALKLGTSTAPEALIAAANNDPTTAAGYESAPDVALASGEAIVLTITPGTGATQGAGRIIFDSIAA